MNRSDNKESSTAPTAVLDKARQNTTPAPQRAESGIETAKKSRSHPQFRVFEFAPGERIEQFEIIRELGRGGMGQVFRARDTKLGRLVAIKFLALSSPDLIHRFLTEARATARCQHENIVVIHQVDEWDGNPYMVLEFLEGESLADQLSGRVMTPHRAVEVMTQVVRALVRAHEFDIVHRDLKPDNIFVTKSGLIKVLDFGIAKLFAKQDPKTPEAKPANWTPGDLTNTQAGSIVGTMPYMSPEQWMSTVDHRTDLWSVGIIFWELLTGAHPIEPTTQMNLIAMAADMDVPMPSIATKLPTIPADLERVISKCLRKNVAERYGSAAELLEDLNALVPSRRTTAAKAGENPYPGLAAFQERDAARFFGRDRDISQLAERLRSEPLMAIVAPSGVGKSSFVRAGLVPALKSSGEAWESVILRPGRTPLAALAALMQSMSTTSADLSTSVREQNDLMARLQTEPGFLGTFLRTRAAQRHTKILLFVDQFEELYTLVPNAAERLLYTNLLSGVADDPDSPLRVIISMRSDFLDRVAEDRTFMTRVTRGLVILPPIDREGMRAALAQPAEMADHRFESPAIIDAMLDELRDTPGALPLLQFTAAKLWELRDTDKKLLTRRAYDSLGGVGGALAGHADDVLARLPGNDQKLVRWLFERLVTPEGTRALVEVADLEGADPAKLRQVIDQLVEARLLTSRGDAGGGASIEIVHESLITSWPTLRRWREEEGEDSAFLQQLRSAAKQWEQRGRPGGLLWRGEATEEARRFQRRYRGELARLEQEFLTAVLSLADKAARRKKAAVTASFVVLVGLVAAAAVALLWIRQAEQKAQNEAVEAQKARAAAESEATRAKTAEAKIQAQLDEINKAKSEAATASQAAEAATQAAVEAEEKAKTSEKTLGLTYEQLQQALTDSERARTAAESNHKKAEAATKTAEAEKQRAEAATAEAKRLLAAEQARVRELENRGAKLSKGSDLK